MQSWLSALSNANKAKQHRQVVWLAGEHHWAWQLINPWLANFKCNVYVGQTDLKHAHLTCCKASKPSTLLGYESDNVVFDAHHGLFPDALTAISGTILPGGLLFFLTPPLTDYPKYADEFAKARTSLGFEDHCNNQHTIERLIECAGQHKITIIEQSKPESLALLLGHLKTTTSHLDAIHTTCSTQASQDDQAVNHPSTPETSNTKADASATPEQQAIFDHIISSLQTRDTFSNSNPEIQPQHSVHVITADRGRGKSHLLGMLADALINSNTDNGINYYLCAPNKAATHAVYKHLSPSQQQALKFIAPENLASTATPVDVIFIDEAASLPIGQLIRWISQFHNLIMATTTHGYEGTGKGFQIRFFEHLHSQAKQGFLSWQHHTLSTPVRYQINDPLENWLFDAFYLDAEPSALAFSRDTIKNALNTLQNIQLDQAQLAQSSLLKPIFALLVQAHYQTKPSDLRDVLDAPGMHLFVQTIIIDKQQHVIGVCLINDEGPVANEPSSHGPLHQDILNGYRRPRGHLMPQVLTHHMGQPAALAFKGARIVRIAILDNAKRFGLASTLLTTVKNHCQTQHYDYLGSSYADTPDVSAFWASNQFSSIRQGNKQDKASGTQSALVIKGLSKEGKQLEESSVTFFQQANKPIEKMSDLNQQEARLLTAFLEHNGSYESAKTILSRMKGFELPLPKKASKELKQTINRWLENCFCTVK